MSQEIREEFLASVERLRQEWRARAVDVAFVDYGAGLPQERRSKEQMEAGVEITRNTSELCAIGLKGEHLEWLYSFVAAKRPKKILELGTCCGFSSSVLAFAGGGDVYTIEGSCEAAKIAREVHKALGLEHVEVLEGRFADVLPKLLPAISPIDLAFVDGHHERDATVGYFEMIAPFMRDGGSMVFDDISWSDGMKEAWECIRNDSRVFTGDDLGKLGVVVMGQGA